MPLIKCLKCKEELDDSELIQFHYLNDFNRTERVCPFCHTIIPAVGHMLEETATQFANKPKG